MEETRENETQTFEQELIHHISTQLPQITSQHNRLNAKEQTLNYDAALSDLNNLQLDNIALDSLLQSLQTALRTARRDKTINDSGKWVTSRKLPSYPVDEELADLLISLTSLLHNKTTALFSMKSANVTPEEVTNLKKTIETKDEEIQTLNNKYNAISALKGQKEQLQNLYDQLTAEIATLREKTEREHEEGKEQLTTLLNSALTTLQHTTEVMEGAKTQLKKSETRQKKFLALPAGKYSTNTPTSTTEHDGPTTHGNDVISDQSLNEKDKEYRKRLANWMSKPRLNLIQVLGSNIKTYQRELEKDSAKSFHHAHPVKHANTMLHKITVSNELNDTQLLEELRKTIKTETINTLITVLPELKHIMQQLNTSNTDSPYTVAVQKNNTGEFYHNLKRSVMQGYLFPKQPTWVDELTRIENEHTTNSEPQTVNIN